MRLQTRLILLILGIVIGFLKFQREVALPDAPAALPQTETMLLTGDSAVTDSVDVPINPPEELDGLTRAALLQKRIEKVTPFENILVSHYAPLNEVYGQIVDGKPWWGIYGQYYYLKPEKNINGPALQSISVMNPYLLIGLDLPGYGVTSSGFRWNEKLTPEMVEQNQVPLIALPNKLVWHPKLRSAEVHYPVSEWLKTIKPYVVSGSLKDGQRSLELMATNARDMGFNFLWVDFEQSEHIWKSKAFADKPIFINRFFHLGNSCGYEGGCNNWSPYNPGLDDYGVYQVPSKMVIKLWQAEPASINAAADFTFTIYID